MKKPPHFPFLLLLLTVIVLLSGCAAGQAEEPTATETSEITPAQEAPTKPPSPTPSLEIPSLPPSPTPEEIQLTGAPDPTPTPEDTEFVHVADFIPDIVVDLKYATEDNFTGTVIYDFTDAYLRYGTVKKLAAVQEWLAPLGYGLKIWDAYRPTYAQFVLWDTVPDSRYVANPTSGFSSHSRGNTVDITLVDSEGNELAMPTGFDDFSALADRDYSDVSEENAKYAKILEAAMQNSGFKGYKNEWWHYTDETSYEVEKDFVPAK